MHRLGLEQTNEITGRMDKLLREQGLSRGSVGDRMASLAKDPRNLFPDSDAGRAALVEYLNARIATVRGMMPKLSRLQLRADVVCEACAG